MEVVGDLLARDRRSGDPALRAGDRTYSYHELLTTAYKACNVLRHAGVDTGDRIGIEPAPRREPVSTFLGAGILGAVVSFDPRSERGRHPTAIVASVDREGEFDAPPGTSLIVYGGDPAASAAVHWEAAVWGENPAVPPYDVGPDDPLLAADRPSGPVDADPGSAGSGNGAPCSHGELLSAAGRAVERTGLGPRDAVAVRGPIAEPGVLAAGLLAPLLSGAACHLPGGQEGTGAGWAVVGSERRGDAVPEPSRLNASDVL